MRQPPSRDDAAKAQAPASSHAYTAFRILDTHPDYSTATSQDLFVAIFHGPTRASAIAQMLPVLDKMSRDNKGRANILTVVRPRAPMPDEAARHALASVNRQLAEQGDGAHSAVVFEGGGAKALIVRSVVASLSLLAKTLLPIKAFATVDEAVAWLEPHIKNLQGGELRQVRAIIVEMDRRHDLKYVRRTQ